MQITAGALDSRVKDLEKDRDKMTETLYTGNGKPPVLETLAVHGKSIESLTKVAWILLTAVLGLLVSSFWSLMVNHPK